MQQTKLPAELLCTIHQCSQTWKSYATSTTLQRAALFAGALTEPKKSSGIHIDGNSKLAAHQDYHCFLSILRDWIDMYHIHYPKMHELCWKRRWPLWSKLTTRTNKGPGFCKIGFEVDTCSMMPPKTAFGRYQVRYQNVAVSEVEVYNHPSALKFLSYLTFRTGPYKHWQLMHTFWHKRA